MSHLNKVEQLALAIVFQIAAKEIYIPDFPLFVIDDNMKTYDIEQYYSIIRYIESSVDYLLISK